MTSGFGLYIGCAGWSLGRAQADTCPGQGSHLQRYASRFNAVEINSSFYRPHQAKTYARWADSVPNDFRFSVKLPRLISHDLRLRDCEAALDSFLAQCTQLQEKLGCILVQLPPSLRYDPATAEWFFAALRLRYAGPVIVEPRHESWRQAEGLMIKQRIAQAAVDPSPVTGHEVPGGWPGIRYWRLHGSPRIYHSAYGAERLAALALPMEASIQSNVPSWCIFDNTASGAAIDDALALQAILRQSGPVGSEREPATGRSGSQ